MRRAVLAILVLLLISCSKKPSLSSADTEYVRTTLDLMRVRGRMLPEMDSTIIASMLDSAYRRHHTSKPLYTKLSGEIGSDPKRANMIYNAINDSIADK